ncbi:hypothetical protein B0J13DRAFT_528368 [Dactylonectria estremocensis]|uniref:MARVEL domain-containing protein n=1 Tax=Dactylonectria estremocensis TaxID=1079267 RepID=A0A9P9IVB1_9HYPO|nr:hypothetical protein B0J13DRAFT_528368 [Dactylonectria estremocensis]
MAGLICLQWLLRGVQLGSSALILAVYSYFLATLAAHKFHISTSIRVVEGISGSGTLYGLLGVLLVCCLGNIPLVSLIAIILDVGFFACFIYVAAANKHGAGSCRGEVDTPYGKGLAGDKVKGRRGSLALPRYRVACQLQTACLAAAIIAIIIFFVSIVVSIALARDHYKTNRRENHGYGYNGRGFLDRSSQQEPSAVVQDDLPMHPHPDEMSNNQHEHIYEGPETQDDGIYESHNLLPGHGARPYVSSPPYPV